MTVADCRQIDFPEIRDPRGSLTFIEALRHVPFEIKRVYFIHGVPGHAIRAGHAHKALQQILLAIAGSFQVLLDDGTHKKLVVLDRCDYGLYIGPGVWRELKQFSPGAICLALVSDYFDESDYYRDYDRFLQATGGHRH